MVEALSFEQLRDLAFVVFDRVIVQEGLADAFGQECPDADDGWLPGRFGDAAERMQIELGRPGLWPHRPNAALYDVDALYDVVEFLHEYISKPVEGTYHSYFRHTHWEEFDRDAGRVEFRDEINKILRLAETPVALGSDGQIRHLPDEGFDQMLGAELPRGTQGTIRSRVEAAIDDFKASRSEAGLRHAVRDLADALEAVRDDVKLILDKKDERALFETFNRFGIRHLKQTDRLDYRPPFLRWLFYVSLATIHLTLRLADPEVSDRSVRTTLDAATFWPRVLDDLEEHAPPLRSFLQGSRVIEMSSDHVFVVVTSKVRESMIVNDASLKRVEEAIERATGRRLRFGCSVDEANGSLPKAQGDWGSLPRE